MTWYNICTGASPAAKKPSRPLKMRLKPLKPSRGGKEYRTRIPNSKIAGGSVVSMGIIFLLFTKVLPLSFLVDCIHSWILQILAQCTQLHQKLTFSQSPYCRKHDHEWAHLQHLKSQTEIMVSTQVLREPTILTLLRSTCREMVNWMDTNVNKFTGQRIRAHTRVQQTAEGWEE